MTQRQTGSGSVPASEDVTFPQIKSVRAQREKAGGGRVDRSAKELNWEQDRERWREIKEASKEKEKISEPR